MFFLTAVVQFWNRWGFQISVLASLAANLLLSLLSGTRRRRSPYGLRSFLQSAAAVVLWVAYQVADVATTSAVGNLSLSGHDATTEDEQQLVAFWAPFLLLHLGGPDSMTAYSLEDNKLSVRTWADMILYILGVTYTVYNYLYHHGHHRWHLLAASAVILLVGAARYVERAIALWGANLDNMQEEEDWSVSVESRIRRGELGDGEALLLAQDLFPVWRRALTDSSVSQNNQLQRASEMIFSLESWEDMCAVAEMELSLMYDLLYTKAMVAHTWLGYLIRFASPPATAAAAWLFWLCLRDGPGRRWIRASFVSTTCTLLGAAFALDVWWLLRALGSTWTYAFLKARPQWAWLHHQALCAGRWHRLHRAVGYLEPISYRRWSGTIGRYNLLRECTTARPAGSSCHRWLATKAGRYLSELPEDVKKLLLRRLRQILPTTGHNSADGSSARPYDMRDIMTLWGRKALEDNVELFQQDGERPEFGKEFEEDFLLWHIATCVFLLRTSVQSVAKSHPWSSGAHVAAIAAISEYLMFLVAKRRKMLPGLVLHSQLDATRAALVGLWREKKDDEGTTGALQGRRSKEKRLVTILRRERIDNRSWAEGDEGKQLLSDALALASVFTKNKRTIRHVRRMLDFIFKVWVDKLLYAAVRCSRECHAQQLSRGGELTTLLWIIVHHAGPFRIGELKPTLRRMMPDEEKKKPAGEKKPDEEKKKEAEEKKKGEPDKPAPRRPPHLLLPMSMPEQDEDPDEMRIPEDEDREDAQESGVSVEYSTLY